MAIDIRHGDCLEVMRTLPDCSVDSIVTDPPYGLAFMGKRWDYDVPSVEVWQECLRVLKPGGHLLAFAGTRTQHRMAVRIEDAGFEIRDMIAWVYGSGFPKSLDVSKAIDKNNGEVGRLWKFTAYMRTTGLTAKQLNDATGTFMGSHYLTDKSQPAIPTPELWQVIRPLCGDVPRWVDDLVARIAAEREVVGKRVGVDTTKQRIACAASAQGLEQSTKHEFNITAPATPEAQQWQGWGTALKPALEPITMARKPLIGTVAENVLTHGTGAINVDGCRVGTEIIKTQGGDKFPGVYGTYATCQESTHQGRWPANLIHDGSEEVMGLFPQTQPSKQTTGTRAGKDAEIFGKFAGQSDISMGHDDNGGSAARFFYCPKADQTERGDGNNHPTVKPVDLMRYLVRLVTREGGTVLEPFGGSGTTAVACVHESCNCIIIERENQYVEIIKQRIAKATQQQRLF